MADNSDDKKKRPQLPSGLDATLRATEAMYGRTLKAVSAQLEVLQRGLDASMGPAFHALRAVQENHRTMIASTGTAFAQTQRAIDSGLLRWANEMAELSQAMVARHQAQLEAYPFLSKRAPMLSERGWFISYGFSLRAFDNLAESAKTATDDELELIVENLYRTRLTQLLDHFVRKYPARKVIVEQAVRAHQEGMYALSVPVFFAQADGVCKERTKKEFFMGRSEEHVSSMAQERVAALKAEMAASGEDQRVSHILEVIMWEVLLEHHPIRYNGAKRQATGYAGLNRHEVLHGISLDYPTEVNSLKAFSLLSYMATLFEGQED